MTFFLVGWLDRVFSTETTDDAFLETSVSTVAPRISGQVVAVKVQDNQEVNPGDLLVELDPQDWKVKVDQKRAAVATAEANAKAVKAALPLLQARLATSRSTRDQVAADADAANAQADRALADLARMRDLREKNTVSPQEFDAAQAGARTASANLKSARDKLAEEESRVNETLAQQEAAKAVVEAAGALLEQTGVDTKAAELDLSYTQVRASLHGRVTRKAVSAGDYVQAGQSLMSIVPDRFWVIANFKETQLREMRTGQLVEITVDAFQAKKFRAHVDSFQAGTGSRFSLLPPENAVGNYVKVVQRLPVKILFDEPVDSPHTLGPGMSVTPVIIIRPEITSSAVRGVIALVVGIGVAAGGLALARRVRKPSAT